MIPGICAMEVVIHDIEHQKQAHVDDGLHAQLRQ
jgi:hypothetical protein